MFLQKVYCRASNLIFHSIQINFGWSSCKILKNYLPIALNQFTTNAVQNSKVHIERENLYAHAILQTSKNYQLFTEPEYIEKVTKLAEILDEAQLKNSEEIYKNFKFLAQYCKTTTTCISDNQFDSFVDLFTSSCTEFTDEQLIDSIRFLTLLPDTPHPYFKNFVELWSALDDVCVDRLENWSTDKILLVCDCWYALNLAKANKFVWAAIRKVSRKIKKLEAHQVVHSLFFCNVVRKPVFEMFDYEMAFNKLINEMSLNEIGIMSMGFFKTKTPIRDSELIDKIFKRLILGLDTVEDITLVNILKVLRYSSRLPQVDVMYDLLENLCNQIDRISLLSCLHIALLGCDMQLCHTKCINLVMQRFIRDIDVARLKDMERVCHVMSLFNLESDNEIKKTLCISILDKVKFRIKEIMQYPKCLPSLLHYLSLCGYHDNELISSVLEEKYIRHAYGKNRLLGREIFCLDAYTRINLIGTYQGNQLSDKSRQTMGKLLTHYIPEKQSKFRLSLTDKIMLDVKSACDTLFKVSHLKHVLPHFQRPDIIICYDKFNKRGIELSENCPSDYTGVILTKDMVLGKDTELDKLDVLAVIIGGWNNYVRDQNRLTGIFELKEQQLKLLGYKTVTVPWYEWRELENPTDKNQYIRRIMSKIM